jgi:hypothetical protein
VTTSSSLTVTPFCLDEHIALRVMDDFTRVAPDSYKLASGNDGYMADSSPWVITSASNNFASLGVASGHVIWLMKPANIFGSNGDIYAVDSVSGNSLTLRAIGRTSGVGKPPCPPGALSGIQFLIKTLDPIIEEISYELMQTYGMTLNLPFHQPGQLMDPRQMRKLCVEKVLYYRYLDMSKQADGNDLWLFKSKRYGELSDETSRTFELRWGPTGTDEPPTPRFAGRLSR